MEAQNITPRFEFGFGMSYTTFLYSSLSITASGASQVIKFTVANNGAFKGTEIPQVYLGYPPSAGEPKTVLRGFEEIALDIGASGDVTCTLNQRDMRWASLYLTFALYNSWSTPAFGIPQVRSGYARTGHSRFMSGHLSRTSD